MSPRCPCQCKGMGLTASRGVRADAALWKFQYIRLPSNSFTCVCEGLFTVTYTSAAMAAHLKCVSHSRRMLETFSVNLTTPHTATLWSACYQYTSNNHQIPIRLHQPKRKGMCERLAKHKRTRSSLYIDTQNYGTFATRKTKGTLSELAAQMGWCEITTSLL
jgi:hypothetical protein